MADIINVIQTLWLMNQKEYDNLFFASTFVPIGHVVVEVRQMVVGACVFDAVTAACVFGMSADFEG